MLLFQFGDQPSWARTFASLLRSTARFEPALESDDWVLTMPLSRQRLRERGYNQSLVLAKTLAPQKVRSTLLLKVKDTPRQSGLSRNERLQSVRGAFLVAPLHHHLVRGGRVVIVDDVMTSGATLQASSLALRQAGGLHFTGLVFARTEQT